jgi:hypothetical protein
MLECWYGRLEYIMALWYILWPFGNLVVIWYILSPFWYIGSRKIWQPCFVRQWKKIGIFFS